MRNWIVRILCLLLCLCLFGTLMLPAFAAETEEEEQAAILHIQTAEDFLAFADNCRLDSYSWGLTVVLEADIDLTGVAFEGIPVFSGTFEGGNHTITGLSIQSEGSTLGLFRYLESTAVVRDLKVEGELLPQGTRCVIGGIAGSNAGLIDNCRFTGTVSGADTVGGLVGINKITGIITGSNSDGAITGNHFIGGIAGENYGVIRSSTNRARINTTAAQNSVKISEITMETLTGSESADTVTDIGGIAGSSTGVIRSCVNTGDVGYQHMGYNIGGIAGSQSGYISGCTNYAVIRGRKEVGGIVGHMEPTTIIEYTEDTLQILQKQLNSLGSLTRQAISKAQSTTDSLYGQVAELENQVQDAYDAVDALIPDRENPELPDADSIQAAQNALGSAITQMESTLYGVVDATEDSVSSLTRTLNSISGQVAAMGATLNSASENLGGNIADISNLDTDLDLSSKIADCVNHGSILADLNAGGIVGAMALENDLDPEEDVSITGNSSLNFNTELRSVVTGSENHGTVTVKKQNAGGIVGWMALGLAKNCLNTGALEGEAADYVGGIAGSSNGYIRSCSARSHISGASYVGGIAGFASTVTDCRSVAAVEGTEKVGAVLGFWEEPVTFLEEESEEEPQYLLGNYYLVTDADPGAIDGVSYENLAQPKEQEDFFALENLLELFKTVTVRFVYENGSEEKVSLLPGSALKISQIPDLPEREGYTARWEGIEEADLNRVSFDLTFYAEYIQMQETIRSEETDETGMPILFAQGSFVGEQYVTVTDSASRSMSADTVLVACKGFAVEDGTVNQLRYLYTGEQDAEDLQMMVLQPDNGWREVSLRQNGSYLVFEVSEGDTAFCLTYTPDNRNLAGIIGVGVAVVAAAVTFVLLKRKKK